MIYEPDERKFALKRATTEIIRMWALPLLRKTINS